jgi:outer membrane protein
MKKVVLITFFMTAVLTAGLAQFTDQGTILLGGSTSASINFITEKSKVGGSTSTDGKVTSFSLEPTVGYFVMDALAIGAGLNLSTSSFKPDGSGSKSKSSTILLSPFARYYFDKFYAQGTFQVGSQNTEFTSGSVTIDNKGALSGWSLAGGYAIFLNESVTLEPQVGYGSLSYKDKDTDEKSISAGLFVRLGVFIYIAK